MPHVSVTIAGRAYRMACDEGQEEHLLGLGRFLDDKIDELRDAFGEIGDMRLAVMAAHHHRRRAREAQRRLDEAERELEHCAATAPGLHGARRAVAGAPRPVVADAASATRPPGRGPAPQPATDAPASLERPGVRGPDALCSVAVLPGSSGHINPRGHTISSGAVTVLARGLGHTAPTYFCRHPGIEPSNGRGGPHPRPIAPSMPSRVRAAQNALARR